MTRRFILPFCIIVALLSCRPAGRQEGGSPERPSSDIELGSVSAASRIDPVLVYVQGAPRILRAGASVEAAEGIALFEGDRVLTDAVSSAEIAFGDFAVVRVLPSSELSIRLLRSRAASAARDAAELGLGSGAVLAKVKKLTLRDEFLVVTPNSAAGVRGTEFLVRYESAKAAGGSDAIAAVARQETTRIAVRDGRVALLPKGNLLSGLLDGREANPVAGAVVATAFAFAPSAGAGQELAVGGVGAAGPQGAEAAYGALLRAAENAKAAGFDLEAAADPSAFIAAPGSDAELRLRRAMGAYAPSALSAENAALLDLMDRLRDPGASASKLPAALPLERFQAPPTKSGRASTAAPKSAPGYPALIWSYSVSSSAIAEPLTRFGEYLMVVDADGVVRAVNQDGKAVWSMDRGVVAITSLDTALALTALDSVTVVDGEKGGELGRWGFEGWAGTPRSKAVPVPEGVAVATPRGVAVLRAENAALVREILVEGGVSAPPVLAGRELVAVTGKGSLAIIDLGKGGVAAEIAAGLGEEVLAPRYRDGLICAADRSGRIVALDVALRALRWERSLGVRIAAEAEMDGGRVFVWTLEKTLLTLSASDGTDAREPIRGVESAPLLSNGRLYWGEAGGTLAVAEASTGRILKRIPVGEKQNVRALMIGGALYAGTAGGRIIKIDPGK